MIIAAFIFFLFFFLNEITGKFPPRPALPQHLKTGIQLLVQFAGRFFIIFVLQGAFRAGNDYSLCNNADGGKHWPKKKFN